MLPLLALYMLLEQISAAVMPRRPKKVRIALTQFFTIEPKHKPNHGFLGHLGLSSQEVDWLEYDVFSRLSDEFETGDLSVGDAGDAKRGMDDGSEPAIVPTPPVSAQSQNQDRHNRKASDKR